MTAAALTEEPPASTARPAPPAWLAPARWAAACLPRHSLPRSASIALIKRLAPRYRVAALSEIRPLDRRDLRFAPTDSFVMDAVYWQGVGGYEGMLARLWASLCESRHQVLEIGANVGLYTVVGGKAGMPALTRYTAVEPMPAIAEALRRNLALNRIDNVEVIEAAAVPDSAQRVVLGVPDAHRGAPTGAQVIGATEAPKHHNATLTVAARNFADLARCCDLIKIDAEGLEAALLESAMPVLRQSRPTMIVEVLPSSERLAALVVRMAREIGYAIDAIPQWGSDRLVRLPADDFTAAAPARHNAKDVLLQLG